MHMNQVQHSNATRSVPQPKPEPENSQNNAICAQAAPISAEPGFSARKPDVAELSEEDQKYQDELIAQVRELVSQDGTVDTARCTTSALFGLFGLDSLFRHLLTDPRDTVFVHWMTQLTTVMLFCSVGLFKMGMMAVEAPADAGFVQQWGWLVAGVAFLALVYLRYLPTCLLMMHCNVHGPLFNPRKAPVLAFFANHYVSAVMSAFFGSSPETYYIHHVKMHHVEDNEIGDLSTTLPYQRDSILEFAKYYGRFYFCGVFDLTKYFVAKGQYRYVVQALVGEVAYHAIGWTLMYLNWRAAIFMYLIPLNVTRVGMLSGNWVQHAFVERLEPEATAAPGVSSVRHLTSVLTCIATPYNLVGWNDGYHLNHHVHAQRHWADHPSYFLQTIMAKNAKMLEVRPGNLRNTSTDGMLVFRNIDYHGIFFLLITGNFAALAKRVVHVAPLRDECGKIIRDEARILAETAQMLRRRAQRSV